MVDRQQISNPSQYFASPSQLLTKKELSRDEKIQALQQWERDIRQLQVATEENMTGDNPVELNDIHQALRWLGHEPEDGAVGSDKFGGAG